MARLPKVNGDDGAWGNILNEYLSQSHAADGTLNTQIVGAPQLKQNAVTSAAIAPGAVTSAAITDGTIPSAKLSDFNEAVVAALPDNITSVVATAVTDQIDPKVTAAQTAQTSAESAATNATAAKAAAEAARDTALEAAVTSDSTIAGLIAEPDSATAKALNATIGEQVADPESIAGTTLKASFVGQGAHLKSSAKTDGSDQTSVLQGEINALQMLGSATLELPEGSIRIDGTLTLANSGTTPPTQGSLRIVGQGAHWSGRGRAPVSGITTLDIRGTDAHGKIKSNGLGLLSIEAVTFRDTAGTTTPFIYTTNTTLHIDQCAFVGSKAGALCDQDAIVLGGTTQVEGASGWDDGFQGYGTVISRNFFSGIRTCVMSQAFANANRIVHNTVWTTCGNPTGAAFEFDGKPTTGVQALAGGTIGFNLIELPNYKYGIRLKNAVTVSILSNDFFDAVTANKTVAVFLDATALHNRVLGGFCDNRAVHVVDLSGRNTFHEIGDTGIGSYDSKPMTYRNELRMAGFGGEGPKAISNLGAAAYIRAEYTTTIATPEAWIATKPPREVTDAVTTLGSTTVTSATAAFVATDQGLKIGGPGIPSGAFIARVVDSATVELTVGATATATGVTASFARLGTERAEIRFGKYHIRAQGGVPTPATMTGAGAGATASVAGYDLAGTITITTGTGTATGQLVEVTNSLPYTGTYHPVISPANAAAADLAAAGLYAARLSSTKWHIATGSNTPPASTVLKFSYHTIEAQ